MARKCVLFLECTAADEEQCPKSEGEKLDANEKCFAVPPGPVRDPSMTVRCSLLKVEETEILV